MANPFENHGTDPAQEDMRLARAALEKDLATYQDPKDRTARIRHLLGSRSLFVDPNAGSDLIRKLDDFQGDDPIGFILPLAVEVWKREGKYDDPLKYKAKLFRADREKDGYTFINDVFYFQQKGGLVHIHLNNPYAYADADTPGAKLMVLRAFANGLSELAHRILNDDSVKKISATSALLASPTMAKLMETLGFKNFGPITDEFRAAHFKGNVQDISMMEADKDEFCEKAKDAKKLQAQLLVALKEARK